jgi:PII-like signaling protein
MKAREEGLAGATVMHGMMGFGAHSRMHTFKIERLSQDLPIIIEIVDTREKLEKFLSLVDNEIEEGMATLEQVQIHFYRSGNEPIRDEVSTIRVSGWVRESRYKS